MLSGAYDRVKLCSSIAMPPYTCTSCLFNPKLVCFPNFCKSFVIASITLVAMSCCFCAVNHVIITEIKHSMINLQNH